VVLSRISRKNRVDRYCPLHSYMHARAFIVSTINRWSLRKRGPVFFSRETMDPAVEKNRITCFAARVSSVTGIDLGSSLRFDYAICPRNGDGTSAFVKWCRAVDKYDRMAQSNQTVNSLFCNLLRVCPASYPVRNIKQSSERCIAMKLQWHSDTCTVCHSIKVEGFVTSRI